MREFDGNHGAEGSDSSRIIDSDSAFATSGLTSKAVASEQARSPRADAHRERTTANDVAANNHSVPLTRRELRAREQAALEAEAAASVAPSPVVVKTSSSTVMAQEAPAPQALASQALVSQTLLPQVAAAEDPAPLLATPSIPPTSATSSTPTQAQVFSSVDEIFAATDSIAGKVKAPKKPTLLRPVKLPRGTTRPRNAAPSLPHPRVAVKRAPFKRRVLKKVMAFGAMIGAGLMMVATTVPANAFFPDHEPTVGLATASVEVAEVQTINVQAAADLTLTRDGYTATSYREQQFLKYGNRTFLYTNNPVGAVQWPFRIAVPISDGYGYRLDPCSFCNPWHKGVDFTPGVDAEIQVIADGVVTKVLSDRWGLGNYTVIDHVINGQHIQSVYAHMKDGSMRLTVGQEVLVGEIVGNVGNTGESTGPHLHFEIHLGGEPVDPFEWLKANATP